MLYGKAGLLPLRRGARGGRRASRARHPFELEEVDVSTDPELHRSYGERIPVLALDGEELFEFHVDADELARRLQSER